MNYPAELVKVAKRMVWFKAPEETLADSIFFLAHLMTYGTVEDIAAVKRHYAPEQFREALEHAPPGVFDPRSWSYWNTMFGRLPVPPMPVRRFLTSE